MVKRRTKHASLAQRQSNGLLIRRFSVRIRGEAPQSHWSGRFRPLHGVKGDRPTKTRSARVITLDPETVSALRSGLEEALRVVRVSSIDESLRLAGYVFSFDAGGAEAWRPDTVNPQWGRARKAAGVRSTIRLHDLRHWQATQLLDAGVPVTVAARLGHADGTTTMKVYAHRTKRADEQAATVVAAALRR